MWTGMNSSEASLLVIRTIYTTDDMPRAQVDFNQSQMWSNDYIEMAAQLVCCHSIKCLLTDHRRNRGDGAGEIHTPPPPVDERSKVGFWGRCLADTGVRIPQGAWMSLVSVVCVVRKRSLRLADPSSRGVLPTVVCHSEWSRNLKNEATLARVGLFGRRE
jgi:hypothetical protein